ncbi:hypothetical protein TBS_09590 [Thermobispora bispora]|jgi:SAM-dependent methyltransferase|uniref:class I SAM-dependent methyltransferase n=1 Tax=Thermobispora bispora TaxID=2006 RepID=UPI000DB4E5BB|nr:class I SAM-dependent methyltransferase [Thermobispora bispora]MBO2474604.1 class I SAM-dependent methyltransferase [Actinomycetales bacterium]MDI9580060.1 class I SAM-dependent methyltransferase [Thermobispora sp.]PZN37553.1 MAG: class I SAM-dependent methyltransferase [Actinomycetota bacterium]MBX6166487.1 class I SAM-dependent methyltransferase [Thermobispora bispora]QSI48444.1 class I SAM-dependent methyltransferase [Thermobispora bispora]
MDSAEWDRRYAEKELLWSAEPNRWVAEVAADLPPGRGLDLAAGEGRNALWLAERGWTVTAVDFSKVALGRARALAERRLGEHADRLRIVEADLLRYTPEPGAYDLVLIAYFHAPAEQRRAVVRAAAGAVAPGGLLLIVGHDSDNLANGVGGPQDPAVLYSPRDLAADLAGCGLEIVRAETRDRPVEQPEGTRVARDAFLLARRG